MLLLSATLPAPALRLTVVDLGATAGAGATAEATATATVAAWAMGTAMAAATIAATATATLQTRMAHEALHFYSRYVNDGFVNVPPS
jgi:hypothetical protein